MSIYVFNNADHMESVKNQVVAINNRNLEKFYDYCEIYNVIHYYYSSKDTYDMFYIPDKKQQVIIVLKFGS